MHLSKYYKRNEFYYIINNIKNRSRFKMIFLTKDCLEFGKSTTIFGIRRVVYGWSSNICGVDELGTLNAVFKTHPEEKNRLLENEVGFLIIFSNHYS